MNRKPFAVKHRISNAILWHGSNYDFFRKTQNDYGEPVGEKLKIETVRGIYHANREGFVELLNTEGASLKSKLNKGILCYISNPLIEQGDIVYIGAIEHNVVSIEPVMYSDVQIATEISIEEVIYGGEI